MAPKETDQDRPAQKRTGAVDKDPRVEQLFRAFERGEADLRHGHEEHLSEMFEKGRKAQRWETLEEELKDLRELEKQVQDLEQRQIIDETNAKVLNVVCKYAFPVLLSAVAALFGWVWNSHSGLVRLDGLLVAAETRQDDANQTMLKNIRALENATGRRYTSDEAKQDNAGLREDCRKSSENLRSVLVAQIDSLTRRLERIDDQIRRLHFVGSTGSLNQKE